MKNLRTPLGIAALVGLSLTTLPAHAHAAENTGVDTDTPIGEYWEQNQEILGSAVSDQVTYANGATEQRFENGVVTEGKWGGVQALTGTDATTFIKAGGTKRFGNAESASWNHNLCGTTVTTHDGKTRWMIVLDENTQPGSYIDLRSPEADQWRTERLQTRSCIPNNAESFGDAANKIADARAVATANGVAVAETGGSLSKLTEDLVVQDFGDNISGIYSISQDRALMINTNAVDAYASNIEKYGSYLYQNEFSTNHQTGALELRALFYTSQAENCSPAETGNDHGYALYSTADKETVISHYFIQYDDYGTCINWDNETAASPVNWAPGLMDRTATGTRVNNSYDWSEATYLPIQQVLELRINENKVIYIKADSTGQPLAGAKPVESSALTAAKNLTDRNRFSLYNDWAYGGSWNIWNELTMLGAPTEEATESTANGTTMVTQKFEGGTLTWTKDTAFMNAELNELGKAKLDWYKSLGL